MSHKSAKKVRRLLKTTGQQVPDVNAWQERSYTEDVSKRKKQLVELKTGELQEIDTSTGQLTLRQGSGRAVYKLVKKAMTGQALPKRKPAPALDIREVTAP